MINQEQYQRLCDLVQSNLYLGGGIEQDVADLLESFEVLHAELDRVCAAGSSCVSQGAFDALYTDDGEQRVVLVNR